MTPRTCNFWWLKLSENLWSVKWYFIFFLWPFSESVSTLVHHIHFKLACNNTYNFVWKFHIIVIDKCTVSSRKLYFRYAFSDNFTFIIVFFRLMVSDFKNTNNSVGILRWVPRLLIWWCYGREKLKSKSNYHRRIWILKLLYVNLSLWFKTYCRYCTVILIHPEQTAIIFIEIAKF